MKDFLTVKEFAELANKTPQTIYKQLDKRLSPYVKSEKGQKLISAEALKEFYGVEQPIQPDSTENQPEVEQNQPDSTAKQPEVEVIQPDSTAEEQPNSTEKREEKVEAGKEKNTIETLNKLIEIIQQQLEEKDKQLAIKDKQIQDLSDRLAEAMQLTRGQQYIAAADKATGLLEADSKRGQQEEQPIDVNRAAATEKPASTTDNIKINTEEEPERQRKKSFWQRIFRR